MRFVSYLFGVQEFRGSRGDSPNGWIVMFSSERNLQENIRLIFSCIGLHMIVRFVLGLKLVVDFFTCRNEHLSTVVLLALAAIAIAWTSPMHARGSFFRVYGDTNSQ